MRRACGCLAGGATAARPRKQSQTEVEGTRSEALTADIEQTFENKQTGEIKKAAFIFVLFERKYLNVVAICLLRKWPLVVRFFYSHVVWS